MHVNNDKVSTVSTITAGCASLLATTHIFLHCSIDVLPFLLKEMMESFVTSEWLYIALLYNVPDIKTRPYTIPFPSSTDSNSALSFAS